MTPLPADVIHVWFQPQRIDRCKDCKAAVTWRETRRRGKPLMFTGVPAVLHHFEDYATGKRVDVLAASAIHFKRCPGPMPGSRRDRRRRRAKPITLTTILPPHPQRSLL